jgi:hypothetical protein
VLLAGLGACLVALSIQWWRYPWSQEGYMPSQPIAFSHRLHAGELQMSCLACHYSATKSPHAGIPPASLCMSCHRQVTASWQVTRTELEDARREGRPPHRIISPEMKKLYDALGLDEQLQPKEGIPAQPIPWVKVHNVPDYTRFDHRAHVSAKVACQECHGPVETMDVIRQAADLSMGWCVKCHKDSKEIEGRKVSPSTDCATCHY